MDVVRPRQGSGSVHLLVDSTGLKLCGSGEWLLEKHGTKTRRSWRKLHIAVDADTGRIAAATLTASDLDDASQVGALLDRVDGPVASFIADGAYDQDGVYGQVAVRHPEASVIVPPRSSAVPSDTAETAPTMRAALKDRAFAAFAEIPDTLQLIVLDNVDVPEWLVSQPRCVHFTGQPTQGRPALFPTR